MILDIGCGIEPRGGVNIDVDREILLAGVHIQNFIIADAHYLPFRHNCFKIAYAHHVLEHLQNPVQALQEMRRVAEKTVLYVPSAYNLDRVKGHVFSWTINTFLNLLLIVFQDVEVEKTRRKVMGGRIRKFFNPILISLGAYAEIKAVCR